MVTSIEKSEDQSIGIESYARVNGAQVDNILKDIEQGQHYARIENGDLVIFQKSPRISADVASQDLSEENTHRETKLIDKISVILGDYDRYQSDINKLKQEIEDLRILNKVLLQQN